MSVLTFKPRVSVRALEADEVEMRFDPETGVVDFYMDGHWIYDVDLNRFKDPAEALDWIRQLVQKNWVTPEIISDLCTLAMGFLQRQNQ